MYDAGAIVFNIKAAGAQVFTQELNQADKAVKELGASQKVAAKETGELGTKQDKAAAASKKLAQAQAEAAKKAAEYSAAQRTVGTTLVTAGAAIVAVTALTVKSAIQWESAWAGVTKTVDGTAAELAGVESGLRDLTGVLPASHQEIAAVAEAAGQLGVETKNVVAFTRTMIDLGETTNLSANDAATALARFMNVMGTSQEKVSNLGSSVVALGNNYATTEAEIVNMATRLSGAARQVGLTEGETMGLAAALSSVGIEAEAGGSAVSKVMIDIAASVDKGGERVEKFAKIAGMSADDFTKKWKTDPGAALAAFVKGLADAEKQGGSTLGMLEELGITETRMRDALLRSAAASDQFTKAMGMGNKAFAENNALQAEAAKRYETVESKIQIMNNRINDAAIDLGSVFLPAVAEAVGGIADLADGVASLPGPVKDVISSGGLAVGIIALIGGTALLAIPKIVEFRVAVATLAAGQGTAVGALGKTAKFLMGPWGIAIAAAIIGVVALTSYLDSLKASGAEMEASLRGADSAVDIFATNLKGKSFAGYELRDAKDQVSRLNDALIDAGENWQDWTNGISPINSEVLGSLKDIGENLAALASADLPEAQEAFRNLADETDGSRERLWQLLSEMPKFRDELISQAKATGDYSEEMSEAEKQTLLLELAQGTGARQSKSAARAYIDAADGADALRKDLDQLIEVLNKANGVGQDAVTANIDYRNTLAEVDEQIQKAREGQKGYALTLDENTQAGRDNMGMLVDLSKDAWDAAEAQHALDGNTEAYRARLEGSRQTLLDRIHDLGLSGQAAEDLANLILKIPSETEWEAIATTAAATVAVAVENFINAYNGKTITMKMFLDTSGGNKAAAAAAARLTGQALQYLNQADGGKVVAYADGGRTEQHQAQFARAGDIRVWAEPETGGEYYIPMAQSKRPRSLQLTSQLVNELGYQMVPKGAQSFADGERGPGSDAQIMGGRDVVRERPIEMDGRLFAVFRELANGEARIVLEDQIGRAFASRLGR